MSVAETGDPRLRMLLGQSVRNEAGSRPTIRLPHKGISPIAIAIGALMLAVLLFATLNARRTALADASSGAGAAMPAIQFEAPPPLQVPPEPVQVTEVASVQLTKPNFQPIVTLVKSSPAQLPQTAYTPQAMVKSEQPTTPEASSRPSAGSVLVIDTGVRPGADVPAAASEASPFPSANTGGGRMRASYFANRSVTVPQGYLIPAVLETGFDSTSPGFARAIVSRDVHGFDGKALLIPRGSRLIGEYQSEVSQGRNRVAIIWTRLIRPDGMTIAIDSPAVDTVGRGGVEASVNTHFFQRLGDALLQSTFEIGRVLTSRAVDTPVIVIPGSPATGATITTVSANNYAPTLKIRAGRSISVFVAHDLDFSVTGGVE